VHPYCSA